VPDAGNRNTNKWFAEVGNVCERERSGEAEKAGGGGMQLCIGLVAYN
jgi:hypothetical protein